MTSMNKKNFTKELAAQHGWNLNEANERLDAVLDTLVRVMVSGKATRVAFTGFGVFETVTYKAKNAWDLARNVRMLTPERRGMRFRPGTSLKAMMRGDKPLPEGRSAALKSAKTRAGKTDA